MKKRAIQLLLLAAIIGASSCNKNNEQKGGIFKGQQVAFHGGKAHAFIQLAKDARPEKIGISINDQAWNNLPIGGDQGHNHANSVTLPLPVQSVTVNPFNHIGLDWNPAGHEPENVYTKPHFDFHFYLISEPERLAIPPYETNAAGFDNLPAAPFLPATYFASPGGVPQMGKHWLDATAPELNGSVFTETFIYGSYNGKLTFLEPMVTKAFIEQSNLFERAIPQPQKFKVAGFYPTKLKIARVGTSREITLENFVYREAGN